MADNDRVGSVYEVGIDGTGYMLADHPEIGGKYKAQTVQLDPQRFATGDTPFSEAIERYTFIGYDDWQGGEGQLYADKPSSDPTRFYYSEGIDPFTEPGEIRCLTAVTKHISDASADLYATVASGSVYVLTDVNELTARDTPSGSNTVFTPMGAGTVSDLASDGTYWYATNGAAIRRNTTAANPGADWSTVAVTEIEWIGDRLAGLDTAASNFTTFDSGGLEEVAGGRFTHTGANLLGIAAGDGYVWWGVNRTDTCCVYAWQLDSTDGAFIALTLPYGEVVAGLFFYLGNVMVATKVGGANEFNIYRCVPSEGRLTPSLVVSTPIAGSRVYFAGRSRFVAFSWPGMLAGSDYSGIGVLDLESGGYARWNYGANTGKVAGVVTWSDRFGFTVATEGFWGRPAGNPTYVEGYLRTSTSDLASNVIKAWDEVTIATHPISSDAEIDVYLSTNSNESYSFIGTMPGSGATDYTITLDDTTSANASLKLVLRPPTTPSSTPQVRNAALKCHPLGPVDQVVQLSINCADRMPGLNGKELSESGPGTGIARASALRALTGSNVSLQDIDWPVTGESLTWQVVACEVSMTGVYDRHLARRSDAGTAMLTLRRPG